MKSKKVILDTNLWISFLITKNYSFLDKYIETEKIKLVLSVELIEEFLTVTARSKFKSHFTRKDIEDLLRAFHTFGILITVTSNMKLCRDGKDDFLLNLALDSNADFLITGDKDLPEIKNIERTRICTISELKKEI